VEPPLWTEGASPWPHEREALAFVRSRLPNHEPYRAWTNVEFIAEGSKLAMEGLDHQVESPQRLYPLYSILNRIRLRCSAEVLAAVDDAINRIRKLLQSQSLTRRDPQALARPSQRSAQGFQRGVRATRSSNGKPVGAARQRWRSASWRQHSAAPQRSSKKVIGASPAPDSGFLDTPERMAPSARPVRSLMGLRNLDWASYDALYVAPVDTTHVLAQSLWER
jgi:hypothetical protein